MQHPRSFVDIHCHLLPGLDDGAASWDESLAMARLAAADGISTVVATPHQSGSRKQNDGETIRDRCRQLQELLNRRSVRLRVLPGADVRVEADMVPKIHSGELITLADRRQYVLLELPHELYLPLDRLLGDLDAAGLIAILSHPERNRGILAQPRLLPPLVDAGCLLQVTAGSLVGAFGPQVQSFAQWLVTQGLAHFVATDAHGSKSRRPLIRRAFDRVAEIAGRRVAGQLCCGNPARVVAGQLVAQGRGKPTGARLTDWLRWGKAG